MSLQSTHEILISVITTGKSLSLKLTISKLECILVRTPYATFDFSHKTLHNSNLGLERLNQYGVTVAISDSELVVPVTYRSFCVLISTHF